MFEALLHVSSGCLTIQVHLWDLSGDSQYFDVRTELYNGTNACFLVFDVTNPSSFENLGNLYPL